MNSWKSILVGTVSMLFVAQAAAAGKCKNNYSATASDDYARELDLTTNSLKECLACSNAATDGVLLCSAYHDFIYKVKIDGTTVAIHFIKAGKIVSTIPAND